MFSTIRLNIQQIAQEVPGSFWATQLEQEVGAACWNGELEVEELATFAFPFYSGAIDYAEPDQGRANVRVRSTRLRSDR